MQMPFGKYVGHDLSEIPDDYLYWLLSLRDLKVYLKIAIERELDRREFPNDDQYASGYEPEKEYINIPHNPPDEIRQYLKEAFNSGFQTLCMKYHPDVGGDQETMRHLIDARKWFREFIVR